MKTKTKQPQHTKGPWRFQLCNGTDGKDFTLRASCGERVFSIATGVIPMNHDARLIAAAPDLLEAAQWAKKALAELQGSENEEPKILSLLCDAIARAEGR